MSTTENNKLLAEFMGLSIITFNKEMYLLKWKNNLVQQKDDTIFKFNSDWNWLMEVIEKIENTRCYVTIKGCAVNMSTIVETSAPTKIEAVYNACVEFVKWYNQQKEQ